MTPEEQMSIQNMFYYYFLLPENHEQIEQMEWLDSPEDWENFVKTNFVEAGKISQSIFDESKTTLIQWLKNAYNASIGENL